MGFSMQLWLRLIHLLAKPDLDAVIPNRKKRAPRILIELR